MKLIPAKMEHVFAIYELVQETIKEVYSKYYAPGVVSFCKTKVSEQRNWNNDFRGL